MKIKRIVLIPPFSFEARATLFLGILGGMWLLMEPLSAFGLAQDFLKTTGWWGYVTLLVFSLILTGIVEYLNRKRLEGKLTFIALRMVFTTNGSEHFVQVPQHMRVGQFLELFVKSLKLKRISPIIDIYDLKLHIKRNGVFQPIPNEASLAEAGILSSDECRIIGKVRREYMSLSLSISSSSTSSALEEEDVDIIVEVAS